MLRSAFPVGVLLAGLLWALGTGTGAAQDPAPAAQSGPAKQQSEPASGSRPKARKTPGAAPAKRATKSRYRPDRFAGRAGTYYRLVWGIDNLVVRWGESGEVIRFSYSVLDANKAKALNDKRSEPSLIDPERGVSLVVPAMENVGQLRQSTPPENGKAYWMVFSNKGRLVRRGDHVNVVIGAFHADGLVVD
jgi:hypothetical protein